MANKKNEEGKKDTVVIHLFKDGGKYSRDKFVGIGGKTWLIKRGVDVEVPVEVAQVIEQGLKQDNATADLIYRTAKNDGE